MTVAVLGCSNSRMIIGEKLVSDDCAQSIDEKRSPACQSRRPDEVEAGAVRPAAVIANRDVASSGVRMISSISRDVGQADERARPCDSDEACCVLTESAPAR